jgi:N-alpha-acetyltransferase 38, NatC auxiliary subunit
MAIDLGQECNIILSQSYEYRPPTAKMIQITAGASSITTLKADMTSRFLGLIVVPGQYINKIEIENH